MKAYRFLAVLVPLLLINCVMLQVGVENTPNSGGSSTVLQTPVSAQLSMATQTPTVLQPPAPSEQFPPAAQSSPEAQQPGPASPTPQVVKIYLIALEDNGQSGLQVGCGDSAVPVQMPIFATKKVLKAAMQALLSLKVQYYGQSGLYNTLYQSHLQLDGVNIKDGVAIIDLSGNL